MSDFYSNMYNPDVLTCLANLSNDGVFTPPEVANRMLDMLPGELWHDSSATSLDPACESGVLLREIAKRLIEELKEEIPDLQERIDHVFHKQLYGTAITELTSLLSRRSVYCSKYPNSKYSITLFEDTSGSIRYRRIPHRWQSGKYLFCGASKSEYERRDELETHVYEWIHTTKPEKVFKMKFDVIIGNSPYQVSDEGNGASAKPVYHLFIEQAKKPNPRFLMMITPSRWFNGGKGLDKSHETMLNDNHITHLVDYQNAKDYFPGIGIGGGMNYFLWERSKQANCTITNVINGQSDTQVHPLNQFPVFVRYNEAIDIITKVKSKKEKTVVDVISSRNPLGLATNARGDPKFKSNSLTLYSSNGVTYIEPSNVTQRKELIEQYKVMISRVTSEHVGEPGKDGKCKVIAKSQLLKPNGVRTDSYVIACPSGKREISENFYSYLCTKFARFLILQTLSSIDLSRDRYELVPVQDFSKSWIDAKLYEKYGLTEEEIALIESMIKPMELGGDDGGS